MRHPPNQQQIDQTKKEASGLLFFRLALARVRRILFRYLYSFLKVVVIVGGAFCCGQVCFLQCHQAFRSRTSLWMASLLGLGTTDNNFARTACLVDNKPFVLFLFTGLSEGFGRLLGDFQGPLPPCSHPCQGAKPLSRNKLVDKKRTSTRLSTGHRDFPKLLSVVPMANRGTIHRLVRGLNP